MHIYVYMYIYIYIYINTCVQRALSASSGSFLVIIAISTNSY